MRIALLVCVVALTLEAQPRIPVIFDTDIGDDIDDALALALALNSPELDVRAVTTVIDDVALRSRLAWKQLGIFKRRDIPVASGISEPLLDPRRTHTARQFEVLTPEDPAPPQDRRRAVDLIVDTLMNSREKITLVPVGPLTNIALALRTEPRIKDKIERIVLMGGAFDLLISEYNIKRDRIAAQIVFSSGVPITAVGLDVTLKCRLTAADMARLRAAFNPASAFLVRLIELWQNGHVDQYPILHDPLAVAAVFRPDLLETAQGSVEVSVADPVTYGVTKFTASATGTTRVAKKVNSQAFVDLLVSRLSQAPR